MSSDFEKMNPKNKAELEKLLKNTQTSINAIVMEQMSNREFNMISWQLNIYTTTINFAAGLLQSTVKTAQEIIQKEFH